MKTGERVSINFAARATLTIFKQLEKANFLKKGIRPVLAIAYMSIRPLRSTQ